MEKLNGFFIKRLWNVAIMQFQERVKNIKLKSSDFFTSTGPSSETEQDRTVN